MLDAERSRGAILEASGVGKRLAGRTVLDEVSVRVTAGEVVGLLGPNGAGKSTLFRILMGLLRPDAGRVLLDGEEITSWPIHRRARRGLGYLPQEPSAFTGLTAQQNLEAVLELGHRPRSEAGPLLEGLGLTARRSQRAGTLSGGERRRLELARLLATRPRLLLLDEPLRGLDAEGVAGLRGIVEELVSRGAGVLLTDHPAAGLHQALGLCRRLYILKDGRVVASGSPEEVAGHSQYFGFGPAAGYPSAEQPAR